MKMKNSLLAMLLALMMALSLTACGGGDGDKDGSKDPAGDTQDPAGDTQEPAAQADPLEEARKVMADAKSMDAVMVMEMDMTAGGQSMETTTMMAMSMFTDPMKMQVEVEMDMGELGSQAMSVYADTNDEGKMMMYLYDGATWHVQEGTEADIAGYDLSGTLEGYVDSTSNFAQSGEETVDGVDAYKYTGTVEGAELREVLESSSALDSLSSLGLTAEQTEELMNGLDAITVSMWISKADYCPVRYEMDMTGTMQSLFTKLAESVEGGDSLTYDKMLITMTVSNLNNATDFTVPEEAKNA